MKIGEALKTWPGIITGVAGALVVLYGGYSHFHTDAEASQHIKEFRDYQELQYQADKNDRVDRHQREINRIEYQLLSDDLSAKEREYLASKKEELRDLIKCIREDTC